MKTTHLMLAFILAMMISLPVWADEKTAIPTDQALEEVRELLSELYSERLANGNADVRSKAFDDMFNEVEKINEDTIVRYAYLEMILNQAVKQGNVDIFQASAALINEGYQVTHADILLKHLPELSKNAPRDSLELLTLLLDAIEIAINQDQYKAANTLLIRANAVARAARDKDIQKQIIALRKQAGLAARAFNRVKKAMDVLKDNPNDPQANTQAGQYYALVKRRWEKGLPLLAKSDHPQLMQAAKIELLGPIQPEDQVALADMWWDLANDADELQSKSLKIHAGKWYQKAAPELSGINAVKAKTRLSEVEAYLLEEQAKIIKTYAAVISITCDNVFTLYHNGKEVGTHDNWGKLQQYELKVKTGDVIAVYAKDHDSGNKTGGLFCSIKLDDKIHPSSENWFYIINQVKDWNTSKSLKGWNPVNTEMVHPVHLKRTYPDTAGRFFWCSEPKNTFYAKWIVP